MKLFIFFSFYVFVFFGCRQKSDPAENLPTAAKIKDTLQNKDQFDVYKYQQDSLLVRMYIKYLKVYKVQFYITEQVNGKFTFTEGGFANKYYGDPEADNDPETGSGMGIFKYFYGADRVKYVGVEMNRQQNGMLIFANVKAPLYLKMERLSALTQNYPRINMNAKFDETPYQSGFDADGKPKD